MPSTAIVEMINADRSPLVGIQSGDTGSVVIGVYDLIECQNQMGVMFRIEGFAVGEVGYPEVYTASLQEVNEWVLLGITGGVTWLLEVGPNRYLLLPYKVMT